MFAARRQIIFPKRGNRDPRLNISKCRVVMRQVTFNAAFVCNFSIFIPSIIYYYIDHLRSGNRTHVAFLYFCDIGKEIILQQRLINDV